MYMIDWSIDPSSLPFVMWLCSSSYHWQSVFPDPLISGLDMEWMLNNGKWVKWQSSNQASTTRGIAGFSLLSCPLPLPCEYGSAEPLIQRRQETWGTLADGPCWWESPRQAQTGLAEPLLNCKSMSKINAYCCVSQRSCSNLLRQHLLINILCNLYTYWLYCVVTLLVKEGEKHKHGRI